MANKENAGPPVSNEPSWDRLALYLRDRGEDNYKKHVEVARDAGVSIKWLEERLREESVQGFELEDGSWVTTLRSVWTYLERDPPETPRHRGHRGPRLAREADEDKTLFRRDRSR